MALSFAKILAPARINCPSTKWDRKMNDSSMTDWMTQLQLHSVCKAKTLLKIQKQLINAFSKVI